MNRSKSVWSSLMAFLHLARESRSSARRSMFHGDGIVPPASRSAYALEPSGLRLGRENQQIVEVEVEMPFGLLASLIDKAGEVSVQILPAAVG